MVKRLARCKTLCLYGIKKAEAKRRAGLRGVDDIQMSIRKRAPRRRKMTRKTLLIRCGVRHWRRLCHSSQKKETPKAVMATKMSILVTIHDR